MRRLKDYLFLGSDERHPVPLCRLCDSSAAYTCPISCLTYLLAYLFTVTLPVHFLLVGELSIRTRGPVIPIRIIFRPKRGFESKSIPATVGAQSALHCGRRR